MGESKPQSGRWLTGRVVLLVFSLSALADSAWSMFDGRSVAESVTAAILGLAGTPLLKRTPMIPTNLRGFRSLVNE
jgi:hypothetical protein